MYQASAAFHDAAMADAQARLLMQFADGTFLTGEDVTDIEITYPLNEDTDLTVGKCVSAELRTTVLNYHGLLSGFGFGDCAVSLGTLNDRLRVRALRDFAAAPEQSGKLLALIPCSASAEAFLARWGGELGTDYVLLSGRSYDPLEGLLMAEQPAHGAAQTEAVRS